MSKTRLIFFGTPQLSATILEYLLTQETLEIVAVVTNPDAPAGRGHTRVTSPVGEVAKRAGLFLLQPEKIRTDEAFLTAVRDLQPDIGFVVAYGKILPQILIDIPRLGLINVHTSLLPKYRGAAPIQYALLHGETEMGLTTMQMSLGMDEGDILLQEPWKITDTDTTG
jgi:methionyl-tRNA formyltransferase